MKPAWSDSSLTLVSPATARWNFPEFSPNLLWIFWKIHWTFQWHRIFIMFRSLCIPKNSTWNFSEKSRKFRWIFQFYVYYSSSQPAYCEDDDWCNGNTCGSNGFCSGNYMTNILEEYHVPAGSNVADTTPVRTILTVSKPFNNHNVSRKFLENLLEIFWKFFHLPINFCDGDKIKL